MLLRVLQLADSAFPTGGFAHSAGLEAALQLGEEVDVPAFAIAALWQAGAGALPFVRAAHGEPARAPELDRWCEATLTNHVARRASRQQGRAWALAVGAAFPALAPVEPRHLAVGFGASLRALAIGEPEAMFLHVVLRGVLSAGVRLGAIGTLEAQRVQAELAAECARVLAAPFAEPAQTAPALDLAHSHHDGLYSRLFQS